MFIDIGNTNIKIKIANKIKVFPTASYKKAYEYITKNYKLETVYVSSVVKELSIFFKKEFKKELINNYFFSNKDRYSYSYKAKGMGVDRLLADEGAISLYDAPLIVVDAGSAITLEYISNKKYLEGGLILPGLRLGVEALYKYASLLPLVKYNKVLDNKITRNKMYCSNTTNDAIAYGVLVPVLAVIEDFAKTFNSKNLKIILTGGDAKHLYKNLKLKNVFIEHDLVFKGMESLIKRGDL